MRFHNFPKMIQLYQNGKLRIVCDVIIIENSHLLSYKPYKNKLKEKYYLGKWNNGVPEGNGLLYIPN